MAAVDKEQQAIQAQLAIGEQRQLLVDAANKAQQWFGMNVDGVIKARPGKQQHDVSHQLLYVPARCCVCVGGGARGGGKAVRLCVPVSRPYVRVRLARLEALQEMFRDYRRELDDALNAIDPDALRNSIVSMLARKRGLVEREVIDLLCLSVVKGFKYPTMVLLAKCAVKIHEQLQSIRTPLQTRCPPAHDKLIRMITTGFVGQIEACVEFVNNFLRLEVFIANRRHPEYARAPRTRRCTRGAPSAQCVVNGAVSVGRFKKVARGMRGEANDPEMKEVERPVAQFVRPEWSNSEFCYVDGCHRHLRWGFGVRHHCRSCGLTVCGAHSSGEDERPLEFELEKHHGAELVCKSCYDKWKAIELVESRGNHTQDVGGDDFVKSPGVIVGHRRESGDLVGGMELPSGRADADEAKQTGDSGSVEHKTNEVPADVTPLVVVEPKPLNPLEIQPPRAMRRMLCDKRDEQLVATLVEGGKCYGRLMKEKLGHHVSCSLTAQPLLARVLACCDTLCNVAWTCVRCNGGATDSKGAAVHAAGEEPRRCVRRPGAAAPRQGRAPRV